MMLLRTDDVMTLQTGSSLPSRGSTFVPMMQPAVLDQQLLQDILSAAQVHPPHAPGLVQVSETPLGQLASRPLYQVRHHQESTERQYTLRKKALELGWSESLIPTLDRHLGKTGTEMAAREGFKPLAVVGPGGRPGIW
jgi:hypothetical protein